MTPHVCGYYKLRHGYAELSEGEGFTHNPIYGVTVRNSAGQDPANLSRVFPALGRALDYIKALS